jgi:diguanylate cyclase (GGDEF)-like protein
VHEACPERATEGREAKGFEDGGVEIDRPAPAGPRRAGYGSTTALSFGALPRAARIYVGTVILAGAVAVALALLHLRVDQPTLFIILLLVSPVAATIKIPLPRGSSSLVSYTVDFASLLILGPHPATIVVMMSAWSQCTFRVRQPNASYRTVFSMASLVLSVQATGVVLDVLGRGGVDRLEGLLRALGPGMVVYFVVNTGLVATAVALASRQRLLRLWQDDFLWNGPSYFIGTTVAALAAIAMERGAGDEWLLLIVAPIYLTYRSYHLFLRRITEEQAQAVQASDVQLATIEALALAIEAKDGMSETGIRRMQAYVPALGRAVGMPEEEIRGLQTAALLHDIGNLAVPEHIRLKPGSLTYEEFQKVKIHPRVGAEILKGVPFPYPVAPLILAHHEHWDGSGYPQGLKRDQIPLGARVLAVVDSFTALSTDRPHRPGLPLQDVVSHLQRAAGTILDPHIAATFLEILPALEFEFVSGTLSPQPARAPDEPRVPASGPLEDIAIAHREARAFYEIAQALGTSLGICDTIGLIATNLSNLVPFDCCALFLPGDRTGTFKCHYAIGTEAERVRQLALPDTPALATELLQAPAGTGESCLRSVLVAPLVFDDKKIGVLAIFHTLPRFYTDDHRRRFRRVADQAASVIRNSILFERTREDSFTDALTSLPNRRYMEMYLTQQMARAERRETKVAVVMMDLNRFKEVNDLLGHRAGDRVLREVAEVLRAMVRASDLCVRYGGDEFVAILWECDMEQAARRQRTLEDAVRTITCEVRPGEFVQLSLSSGVAVYPEDGRTCEELLAVADRRMYETKGPSKPPAAPVPAGPAAVARTGA